ncbi:MAG: transporter substrate-binding domain-containing protein [Candidatus Izemoplasmataceae bacterium]
MKKLLLVSTLFLGIFLLAACGRSDEDVLRVGMDLRYPPFETIEDDEPIGISVDVAEAFGEYIGREVEIVNTQFGSLIPALNSGEIDIIIASMSITEERAEVVDFSDPYFYFKIISLVNKDFADDNDITEDTTTEELLAIEEAQYVGIASQVSASIPQSLGKDVSEAVDLNTAVNEISQGTGDILLMSSFPVTNGHRANPDTTVVVWDPFESSPIGMAVAKGNDELLEQANAFIATMDEPGGLYETLSAKWDPEVSALLERYGLEFFINED